MFTTFRRRYASIAEPVATALPEDMDRSPSKNAMPRSSMRLLNNFRRYFDCPTFLFAVHSFGRRTVANDKSKSMGTRLRFRGKLLRYVVMLAFAFSVFGIFSFPSSPEFLNMDSSVRLTVFDQDERPVLNDSEPRTFLNNPVSAFRPANQFVPASYYSANLRALLETKGYQPVLTIITVTKDPRDIFMDSAKFIRDQSLLPIRWLIVNDHTGKPESFARLREAQRQDPRVVLVNNTGKTGFTNGRLFGLEILKRSQTKYYAFLDDDDLMELTAYEKCVWMLESNENVSFCGTFVVGFGAKNYTWDRGFHNGASSYLSENPLTGSEVVRTDVLESTGCTFDTQFTNGMEDWDFYLCVASKGKWGATIPEYLQWYRQNPESLRMKRWSALYHDKESTTKAIRDRYKSLKDKFPLVLPKASEVFETIPTHLPFQNPLHLKKSILLIIPWMAIGGADTANLNIVRELSRTGYRVTIVCSLVDYHGASMVSKPYFMQYTHDIFFLPAMLRLSDAPRFLSYLIESRGVETVLISNSQLGYGVLPWLAAKYSGVRFVDYVHNEEKEWKNGGYAAFSTVHRASLDGTFTSSEMARQFMIDHGHSSRAVKVGYLGIDMSGLKPFDHDRRLAVRRKLGIRTDAVVVTFLARMIDHKRPQVALASFLNAIEREKALIKKGKKSDIGRYVLLLIGNGPKLGGIEGIANRADADVRLLGALEHTLVVEYLGVSDIFCLPSLSEGISFALAEAMALGVAPLVSDLGGFPELVGRDGVGGVLVKSLRNVTEDTNAFSEKLSQLLTNERWRTAIGTRASQRAHMSFDAARRIPELVRSITKHPLRRQRVRDGGHDISPLHYTQENILEELRVLSDFAAIQQAMSGKQRSPYGSRYRATCGEYNAIMTKLIDYLEDAKPCTPGEILDVESIRSFALGQCGQWCIMNLSDPTRNSGWQVSEGCEGIGKFDDPDHTCAKWFKRQGKK